MTAGLVFSQFDVEFIFAVWLPAHLMVYLQILHVLPLNCGRDEAE